MDCKIHQLSTCTDSRPLEGRDIGPLIGWVMAVRIAVVDEDNRFVRWAPRHEIHEQRLVHRSVHVLVFDSSDRLILQQRHRDKQTYPLYWDSSCCGHVEDSDYLAGPDDELDRVYEQVAARELHEELGIRAELETLAHFGPTPGVHYEQLRLFRATSDAPITIQTSEVEQARAVSHAELRAMQADGETRLTHSLRFFLTWLDERGLWPAAR